MKEFARILGNIIISIDLDLRYYMGRHKIKIIDQKGKKALIEHLESGYVGNEKIGYKSVCYPLKDVVLVRHCYYNRRGDI